jgi:superfamily I DNA/RNA helicase
MDVWDEKELKEVIDITSEVLSLSLPNAKFGMLYDYNDMIWWPVMLKLKTSRYDVVLLDEIQDFNACQIDLITRLLQSNVRVIAVGDEFQAVYRFRGADSDAFEKVSSVLQKDTKGSATQLLSTNYRCGKKIIEWVVNNTIVKDIKAAPNAIEGEVKENVSYAWILDTLTKEYGSRDTA